MSKRTMERRCPVCSNDSFGELIDFGTVPQSDVFLERGEECKKIELSFEYCKKCAFIWQKTIPNFDYAADDKKTGHTLQNYCLEFPSYLKKKGISEKELIIEIGCNDGTFLDVLSKSGFTNLLGVEPSTSCAGICKSKGYRVKETYFNIDNAREIKEKYGSASVVICRHVLEHVPVPHEFVVAMKDVLREDGLIFIEVPDTKSIICELNSQELIDQHISYFTENNLERFITENGFNIEDISTASLLGTRTILLWGSKNGKPKIMKNDKSLHAKEIEMGLDACRKFSENWNLLKNRMLEKIKNKKRPLAGLGASHPQTKFLIYSGIGEFVSVLIDDDPKKTGKYACAPLPLPVISTDDFLKSNFKGTIINTAFGYPKWAERIRRETPKENNIEIIEPFS